MNDSEKAIPDPGTNVQKQIIAIDKGSAIVSDTLAWVCFT
jgi:hypothetical protein